MAKQNDKTHEPSHDQKRRSFIKTSVMAGAGAAAAALPVTAAAATESTPEPDKKQKGYQVTQHVVDYYKSASI